MTKRKENKQHDIEWAKGPRNDNNEWLVKEETAKEEAAGAGAAVADIMTCLSTSNKA